MFTIPARFDLYHGVVTVADYLAAVTEHLAQDEAETRSLFPTLAPAELQASYAADVTERGWGMTVDQTRQLRLLLWLADQDDGLLSVEKVYSGGDDAHQARRDVETLAEQGLIEKYIAAGGLLAAIHAAITPQGRAHVDQIRSRQQDRAGRQRACREALVAWLYEVDAAGPRRSTVWRGFFSDPRSTYFGDSFAEREVDRAAGWLQRQGLIGGTPSAQTEGPVRPYLTDRGTCCVEEFGGDVHRYVEAMQQPQPPAAGTTIHLSATNVQLATGDHARQTMTVTQASHQVQETIHGIAEILKAQGLVAGREAELAEAQQEALRDVTSGAGSTTGIRRFVDWVLGCVQAGAAPAVTAAMTTMTGALLQDAEQVIHAIGQ